MKSITILALVASLSACAGPDAAVRLQRVDAALARVEAGYSASRTVAALFAPWLAPVQAARLHALAEGVEIALAAARHATDLASRRAALRRAEAATTAFRVAAGG
ncbi:hypothetical protein Q5H91_09955 [Sphingomonas sp. KR1UV-12]|uniref:Uncharacterized protein n=1 Tax=Sphingomonas aurea TaxID=3063994 RepID=A0ABT9EKQ5_9SPHN|nr:hypothetical protein [Sphingomonas sp. KR1UV-12]MDP1027536.1 hypothetical protein [Sphingomonas sp. KR1UV-12]